MPDAWAGLPAGSWVLAAAVVGLLVGSFLNVLILRLPVMLERAWHHEAHATLHPENAPQAAETFNLLHPRSRCGCCGHTLPWWENIPVLSWLMLRGKCSSCGTRISARYPLVELLTAGLTAATIWLHGATPWALGLVVLLWGLIALAFIDYDTTLLPDGITLPLLWLGLLLHASLDPAFLPQAIWGAAIGYASLWSIYQAFKLLTGKEGMGYGDFKLFAALGAWFGALALLPIILLSAVAGAAIGIALQFSGLAERGKPIPFGPFLATAGLIMLLLGPQRLIAWVLPGGA
ncbi:MAG: prepilin peptidase [Betaproteobacteria bacterium]|jgi:leader peptidase (prepilin peptidase)/N-methyltransferase|nr:prepilin peptidase [Betaproteobacteria bacterium]